MIGKRKFVMKSILRFCALPGGFAAAGIIFGVACNTRVNVQGGDDETTQPDESMTGGDAMDASNLALFIDPEDSTFSTSDVRDVDGEIVKFDTDTASIIWTDGASYQAGSWTVSGNLLTDTSFFQVRFGSEGGERRAYFTETATATLCDISLFVGDIRIFSTSTPVPQD